MKVRILNEVKSIEMDLHRFFCHFYQFTLFSVKKYERFDLNPFKVFGYNKTVFKCILCLKFFFVAKTVNDLAYNKLKILK